VLDSVNAKNLKIAFAINDEDTNGSDFVGSCDVDLSRLLKVGN